MPVGLSLRDFGEKRCMSKCSFYLIRSLSLHFLFIILYFTLSLHFIPGLQSAVCILTRVCSLHFTPGLQSAVCVLHRPAFGP